MVIKTQQNGAVLVAQTEAYCEKPYQAGILFYNGLEQEPTWQNYDPSKMTMAAVAIVITLEDGTQIDCEKALKASTAGYYGVQFTLRHNYKWADGTSKVYSTYWKITDSKSAANDVRLTQLENEIIKAEKDILKLNTATGANVIQSAANYVMNDDFNDTSEVMLVQYKTAAATAKSTSVYYGKTGDSIKVAAVPANSGYIAVIPGEYWWITDQITAEQFQVKAVEGNYSAFVVSSTVPLSKSYPSGSILTRTTVTHQTNNTFKFIQGTELAKGIAGFTLTYAQLSADLGQPIVKEFTVNISKNNAPVIISYYDVNFCYFVDDSDSSSEPPDNYGLIPGKVFNKAGIINQADTCNYDPYIAVSRQSVSDGAWSDYETLQESIGKQAYQLKVKYTFNWYNVYVQSFPNTLTTESEKLAYITDNGVVKVVAFHIHRSTGSLSANSPYGELLLRPKNYALPLGSLQLYVEHDISYGALPLKAFICYEPTQKQRVLHKLYLTNTGSSRWVLGELSATKGTRSVYLPDGTVSKVILDKNIDYSTLEIRQKGAVTTVWRLQHPSPAAYSDTNVPNIFNLGNDKTDTIVASYSYGQETEEWFEMNHDFTDVFTQDSNGQPLSQLSKFIFNIPQEEQGQYNKLKLQLSRATIVMQVEGEVPQYPYTIQCTSAILRSAGFETSIEGTPINAKMKSACYYFRVQNTDGETAFYQKVWRVLGSATAAYVCLEDVLACTSEAEINTLQRYGCSEYFKNSFWHSFSTELTYDSDTNSMTFTQPKLSSKRGIYFRVIPLKDAVTYYKSTAAERKLMPTQWCYLRDAEALCPKAMRDTNGDPIYTSNELDTTMVIFILSWDTDIAIRSIKYAWTSQTK